jgi:hypothetical protein
MCLFKLLCADRGASAIRLDLTRTSWLSTPRLFQDVTLLPGALELGLQALHLVRLGIDSLALRLGNAITVHQGVQATDAHLKPLRYFARWVPTLGYLFDGCNLEFLCVPLAARTFFSRPIFWLRSVYK